MNYPHNRVGWDLEFPAIHTEDGSSRGCGMDGMGWAPGREQCQLPRSLGILWGSLHTHGTNSKPLTPYLEQPGVAHRAARPSCGWAPFLA